MALVPLRGSVAVVGRVRVPGRPAGSGRLWVPAGLDRDHAVQGESHRPRRWWRCSAAAAPRASRSASSWSRWPSRRSTSRRRTSTRSARTASDSPSRSWAARRSTAAARAVSDATGLTECVFGSMAATYQPPPDHKHQPQIWGQPFPRPQLTQPGQEQGDRTLAPSCEQLGWSEPPDPHGRSDPWSPSTGDQRPSQAADSCGHLAFGSATLPDKDPALAAGWRAPTRVTTQPSCQVHIGGPMGEHPSPGE